MISLEKLIFYSRLFDIYGDALTEKQQKIFSLRYNDDFSLGEIAENFAVSRQAVVGLLRSAEQKLCEYENMFGFAGKIDSKNFELKKIKSYLDDVPLGEFQKQTLYTMAESLVDYGF